jgi:phosphatidylglycerophosphate synthase
MTCERIRLALDPRRRGAVLALAAGGGLLACLLLLLTRTGRIDGAATAAACTVYGFGAILLWRRLDRLETSLFGAANLITVLRAALIALLPAFIIDFHPPEPSLGWAIVAGGSLALLLDGVDGRLARRLGQATGFGARFDMEVDAAFVLGLSALVWISGCAGGWVLLSGLMRYLWVGAGMLWPLLRCPVPPSLFRKSVCVAQLALLLAALTPCLAQPWPAALAGSGLCLLILSFGRDLVWLMRGAGMAPPPRHTYLGDAGRV